MALDLKYAKYFASDPDWERFSRKRKELQLKTEVPPPFDLAHDRDAETKDEKVWAGEHPLETVGYHTHLENITVRDGCDIPIKIYNPIGKEDCRLPLLFVTHGGGWVQGSFVTEEAWLLWSIFPLKEFIIVSVEYRLAPEHKYPTYVTDSWDALQHVVSHSDHYGFNEARIYLTGSSAGGSLAAVLAQMARNETLKISGVILNVPVTCHPEYFPKAKFEYSSYDQCFGTLLTSGEMRLTWKMVMDIEEGGNWQASSLLGNLTDLPPHLVFIAGQDPLRDEAFAYVEMLKENKIPVTAFVYPGVPHTFARFWDLEMTKRFQKDLATGVKEMIESL